MSRRAILLLTIQIYASFFSFFFFFFLFNEPALGLRGPKKRRARPLRAFRFEASKWANCIYECSSSGSIKTGWPKGIDSLVVVWRVLFYFRFDPTYSRALFASHWAANWPETKRILIVLPTRTSLNSKLTTRETGAKGVQVLGSETCDNLQNSQDLVWQNNNPYTVWLCCKHNLIQTRWRRPDAQYARLTPCPLCRFY